MIFFDHTYTGDPGFRFLKRLGALGFKLEPDEVEHPGRNFCRFLRLRDPGNARSYSYLEFVYAKDKKQPVKSPGLCFGHTKGLDLFQKKLERDGRYRSKFIHKNYDWKKDNVTRLPGWNFITFSALGLPSLYTWLTEYEPSPKRKKPLAPKHPNGAQRIHGFVLELNPKGEKFLSYLVGKKLGVRTKISGGVTLYITRGKRTRLSAVVVQCASVSRFVKKYGCDEEGEFLGKPSARIKNPDSRMWDLLLV